MAFSPTHDINNYQISGFITQLLLRRSGLIWIFRELSAVPYGHYPDYVPFYTIKEPIRWDKYFSKGKVRKFG